MKCDPGRLQAYLDGALESDAEAAAVEQHLSMCVACQAEVSALQVQERGLAARMSALDPLETERADLGAAWARLRRERPELAPSEAAARAPKSASRPRSTIWRAWKENINMTIRRLPATRWRPAAVGLLALALLVALFSFAPARHAAAQFLGVFRVRKFAVIPIDPAQVQQLESLEEQVDAGLLGEPTILREAGEPQSVADAAAASAATGFNVRVPAVLPEGATLDEFTVETGPAVRMEVDRALTQAMLDAAGVRNVVLPDVDTITGEVDIATLAHQIYSVGAVKLEVAQLPSPTVAMPEGVDPTVLGEAFLQLLGTPAEDAQRLAQTIDWTSTFVIPLPTDAAEFREVEVDGVTGVLLEEREGARGQRQSGLLLLWQRDGIVYAVSADNLRRSDVIDSAELLRIANSLN